MPRAEMLMLRFLRILLCASLFAGISHAQAETTAKPIGKLLFKIDFDPPAGFLGSTQFSSDVDSKSQFRKGHGANQSILLIMQIARVGSADINLEAQMCLQERFAAELAATNAKRVEIKDGVVIGAGVKVLKSDMNGRIEVLSACIPKPYGAVLAVFAQPQLRGQPSEMANVMRALAHIKFTELALPLPIEAEQGF